jgi:hypothetical protein
MAGLIEHSCRVAALCLILDPFLRCARAMKRGREQNR